jgi:hypothetical protein
VRRRIPGRRHKPINSPRPHALSSDRTGQPSRRSWDRARRSTSGSSTGGSRPQRATARPVPRATGSSAGCGRQRSTARNAISTCDSCGTPRTSSECCHPVSTATRGYAGRRSPAPTPGQVTGHDCLLPRFRRRVRQRRSPASPTFTRIRTSVPTRRSRTPSGPRGRRRSPSRVAALRSSHPGPDGAGAPGWRWRARLRSSMNSILVFVLGMGLGSSRSRVLDHSGGDRARVDLLESAGVALRDGL